MSGTLIHLAIADKIYDTIGGGVIKNLPLFFGGNIAPEDELWSRTTAYSTT